MSWAAAAPARRHLAVEVGDPAPGGVARRTVSALQAPRGRYCGQLVLGMRGRPSLAAARLRVGHLQLVCAHDTGIVRAPVFGAIEASGLVLLGERGFRSWAGWCQFRPPCNGTSGIANERTDRGLRAPWHAKSPPLVRGESETGGPVRRTSARPAEVWHAVASPARRGMACRSQRSAPRRRVGKPVSTFRDPSREDVGLGAGDAEGLTRGTPALDHLGLGPTGCDGERPFGTSHDVATPVR
jgi:hypothetical protein